MVLKVIDLEKCLEDGCVSQHANIYWKCSQLITIKIFTLTLSWRGPLSYRNQSTDLQSKSMDWFLYDNSLSHERVKAFYILYKNVSIYERLYIDTPYMSRYEVKRIIIFGTEDFFFFFVESYLVCLPLTMR